MSTIKKPEIHKLENLYGFELMDSRLVINVLSTGCTTSTDFKIDSRLKDNVCEVSVYRIHPDMCKRTPFQETIELSWEDQDHCKNARIIMKNEVLDLR